MAVVLCICNGGSTGGLQERDAIPREVLSTMVIAVLHSGPSHQVSFLLLVLPPMMFARVAASWCPSFLLVHVALL